MGTMRTDTIASWVDLELDFKWILHWEELIWGIIYLIRCDFIGLEIISTDLYKLFNNVDYIIVPFRFVQCTL